VDIVFGFDWKPIGFTVAQNAVSFSGGFDAQSLLRAGPGC
jgi:hypothetical protein